MNKIFLLSLILLLLTCKQQEIVYPHEIEDNSKGKLVAFNGLAETVSIIDLEIETIYNNITETGSWPSHITFIDSRLYLTNSGNNSISIYNKEINFLKSIYLGENKNPWTTFPLKNSNKLYVSCFLSNEILLVNTETENIKVIHTGSTPQGGTISGNKLYIGNTNYKGWNDFGVGFVSVIDTVTNSHLKDIHLNYMGEVGINPQSIVEAVENKLYIICSGIPGEDDGNIFIVDKNSDEISGVIKTGKSPVYSEGSINTKKNIIYLYGVGGLFSYNYSSGEIVEFAADLTNSDAFFSGLTYVEETNKIYVSEFNKALIHQFNGDDYSYEKSYQASDGVQQLLYIK